MWSYYGAKTNVVDFYPKPKYSKIVEPFAGSARYALKYFDRDVLLIDKYETVVNIWKWLQLCSANDIDSLPHHFKPGQSINDFTFDCKAAKDLMGFLIGFGMERPRVTASVKRMISRPNHVNYSLNRIKNNLFKIRHWEIEYGTYSDIKDEPATWFIDPPYQYGGTAYPMSSKHIDFGSLADWSRNRSGQIIVCENIRANWMEFSLLASHKTKTGFQHEGMWTNDKNIFGNQQLKLAI